MMSEREKFEAWALNKQFEPDKFDDGAYRSPYTSLAWEAWQAARALRRTTGYVAPRGRYVPPVLFNPYSGQPRDARDIHSDPQGILIVPPGAEMLAADIRQHPGEY